MSYARHGMIFPEFAQFAAAIECAERWQSSKQLYGLLSYCQKFIIALPFWGRSIVVIHIKAQK